MVLLYERSRSILYVHGVIFQFTSLKYGLGYRFQLHHGAMASQIITLKSPTTGLVCFQNFVHDNPTKFRHNGLLRGESIGWRWFPSQRASNVEGVSTPRRLMITYMRHRYMWNNIHLIYKTNNVHANTRRYILGSWSWSSWYIYIYRERERERDI